MPLSRLLIWILGLSVIFGLMIWLVHSIYRLYLTISWTAPLLANLLLLLLVALLGLLIAAFVYYFQLYPAKKSRQKAQQRRLVTKLPEQKTEAAEEALKALRKQVKQVQDRVAQQALLSRSREIEANLARGELQVVVFGTGSAGKTSLVNAIIGQMVGNVEATMGTTQVGETYRLKLRGLEREILITDTPGILEPGIAGTQREQLARQLATQADLLLFVVDNDLRQSEYEPLQTLAEIGKRSLLVFNKTDLYTDEEREIILTKLRARVRDFIKAADVVAIAANPQPFQLESGAIVEPEPEIIPLIKRLAAVLRAEGEDLIADNILLQSQRLGEEARQIIDRQRRQQADKIIERYQWIGAGVIAVTPLPVVDMLATAAVNAQMVVEIGRVYGCELNSDRGKELALSLGKTLVSLGVVKGAVELLARALQFQIATYLVGKVIQGVTAAYLTRIAGKSFVEYFRHDQDWGDGGITEVVQRQFQLNRRDEFVKAFVKDAIAKVVKPITQTLETEREEELVELSEDDWRS
ncbi:GTP-binding protein [Hydrococcus rivularis NIES-593]|uniref:GTP-binding protein n=1 Tax=Hydrococcus rivularis NIES-593 TaxID=1921803 RepID=A0A1U7HHC2_9CYAN|nr:GTP-binding protein [Hydrococcus rivularis]OKH22983.1 GTP-binding protein [Hydrococcus rivularis NIES-593]